MNDNDLVIKNFRILIVEDEAIAREKLGKSLNRKFNNVTLCENGLDAYIAFQKAFESDEPYDLILSDINMPKMDGIEMLEKIRQLDMHIPSIFITARTETEQMLRAIDLQVEGYITKPLDSLILDQKIDKVCQTLYYKKMYDIQKNEMESYLNIINQEAVVVKVNREEKITYVNDAYCQISGFSKEELLGNTEELIQHPDVSKEVFENIWESLKKGNTWEGTVKNRSKEGKTYFLNSKIMPIFDGSKRIIVEYMCISYLVTQAENKKRQQHKQIIEKITEYKKLINSTANDKKVLMAKVNLLEEKVMMLEEKSKLSDNKKLQLLQQVAAYESNQLELSKLDLMGKQDKHKQFHDMYKSLNRVKSDYHKLKKEFDELSQLFLDKEDELKSSNKRNLEQSKRIEDLKDLVSNLQDENKKLKESKPSLPFGIGKTKE